MIDILLLLITYNPPFTDFRVQVLDDDAFLMDVAAVGRSDFSKLAHRIQELGRPAFLTKNVRKP